MHPLILYSAVDRESEIDALHPSYNSLSLLVDAFTSDH